MSRLRAEIFKKVPGWADPFVLLLLFGYSLFHSLGACPLLCPDEGRYAEIPREMIESGDFLTPRLNYVVYFEKPPLYYWLTALAFKIFGENEFSARFFSAASALGGILLTWWVGKRIFGRRGGMISALLLGTSIGYIAQGRLAIIDMLLACLMTAALGSFYLAARGWGGRSGARYYLFYVFAALAVLAKGLIGIVLPGAIILLYLALARRMWILREMRIFSGAAILLLVAAPWFLVMAILNPDFSRFFFIHEHFQRYLTTVHHRFEPFWFFLPVLCGAMFPWTCFIPSAVSSWTRERDGCRRDASLFLLLWAGVVVVFFSFSQSKLVPYILPAYPAIALVAGGFLSEVVSEDFRRLRAPAYFLLALLPAAAAIVIAYSIFNHRPVLSPPAASLFAALALAEALLVWAAARRASSLALLLVLLLATYIQGILGPRFVLDTMQNMRSNKKLALAARNCASPGCVLVNFGFYAQDLPFYAKRRIVLPGEPPEDIKFGSARGDQSAWFISLRRFFSLWDSGTHCIVLMDENDWDVFQKGVRTPIRIIDRKKPRMLVSNW